MRESYRHGAHRLTAPFTLGQAQDLVQADSERQRARGSLRSQSSLTLAPKVDTLWIE